MKSKKIGELICPICGGDIIQTNLSPKARTPMQRESYAEVKWCCVKCGGKFSADLKGETPISANVDFEQLQEYGVNVLGESNQMQKRGIYNI